MKTKVIGVWLKNWRDKGMPDNIWLYGFDGFNGLKTVGFVVADTDTEAEHKIWQMYNDFNVKSTSSISPTVSLAFTADFKASSSDD